MAWLGRRSVWECWHSMGTMSPPGPPLSCRQSPFPQPLQCSRSGAQLRIYISNKLSSAVSPESNTLKSKVLKDEQDFVKQWGEPKARERSYHIRKSLECWKNIMCSGNSKWRNTTGAGKRVWGEKARKVDLYSAVRSLNSASSMRTLKQSLPFHSIYCNKNNYSKVNLNYLLILQLPTNILGNWQGYSMVTWSLWIKCETPKS